jgi:hypothetical protein
MQRLLSLCILTLVMLTIVSCGNGGSGHGTNRSFLGSSPVIQTAQTSVTTTAGPPLQVSVTWATAFPDTNYTVVCAPALVSGGSSDLSVLLTSKSTTGVQALVQFNDSGTVQVNCLALADITVTDIRHARATFNSTGTAQPSVQSLTWNSTFTDTNYTPVCSVIAALEATPVTQHFNATTIASITTWVNYVTTTPKPFEVDCIGVPDTSTSGVRHGRTQVVEAISAPVSVTMNWDTAFPDTNYVPACDTQFVSGTELSITTNAAGSTPSTQTATVHWATNDGVGTVGCIAVATTTATAAPAVATK